MDREIPTEAHLQQMRERGALYLVGTPKGRLTEFERSLAALPLKQARESVQVKFLPQGGDLYVCLSRVSRIDKERAMRRRKLKRLLKRLKELQEQRPSYKRLLTEIGAAKQEAGRGFGLIHLFLPAEPAKGQRSKRVDFGFKLSRTRLRIVRRRDGLCEAVAVLFSADGS